MSTIEKIMLKNSIKDMLSNLDVDNVADSTLLTQLFDVLYKINNHIHEVKNDWISNQTDNHIKGIQLLKDINIFATYNICSKDRMEEITGKPVESKDKYPRRFRRVVRDKDFLSLIRSYIEATGPTVRIMILAKDEEDYKNQIAKIEELFNH